MAAYAIATNATGTYSMAGAGATGHINRRLARIQQPTKRQIESALNGGRNLIVHPQGDQLLKMAIAMDKYEKDLHGGPSL